MRLYDEYGTRTETEVCMYGLFVHSFCILFLGGCELLNTTLQIDASSVKMALQSTTPINPEYQERKQTKRLCLCPLLTFLSKILRLFISEYISYHHDHICEKVSL